MLKLILKQTNWGVMGAVFGFAVGFFVKIYLIDIVGLTDWGKYVTVQTFSSISETFLSIGIPYVIIKFFPSFVENNKEKASRIANVFLKYAFVIGSIYLLLIYYGSSHINQLIYNDTDGLSWLLLIMCIHVPISMVFGVVISLYRSVLKIKEIVLYGSFISVSVRATLTFIIFQYTDNISHFILIEVFTQILVLSILLFLFSKDQFPVFVKSEVKEVLEDNSMVSYGKKMFFHSVVAFLAAQALSFIISIRLPMNHVGAYNILLSLAGLTTFLLVNLNKVFAPAISKLYNENNIIELNDLYKKTTFLLNILTIPLIIVIAIFSDEILRLYTEEMRQYKNYLFFMLAGGILSLSAGSSGTFMVMAGLEKQNLQIQIIRAIMLLLLPLFFMLIIPQEKWMKMIVILYVIFMLFTNSIQLILISKYIKINPFSKELLLLFLLTIIGMYFAINQQYSFEIQHYFIVPLLVYFLFFILMIFPLRNLIKELLQ